MKTSISRGACARYRAGASLFLSVLWFSAGMGAVIQADPWQPIAFDGPSRDTGNGLAYDAAIAETVLDLKVGEHLTGIVCPSLGSTLFVNAAAPPGGDGSSWDCALQVLQDALSVASDPGSGISEIWVAAGTYFPSIVLDSDATFQLLRGVAIYGGFAGTETALNERDWMANETILSGDIDHDDVYGSSVETSTGYLNNSAHVVTGSGVNRSAVLDGFTIIGGGIGPAGTPAGASQMYGSGMYNISGSPTVRNCTFKLNLAAFAHGAGMYNMDSSPAIEGCTFRQNWVHLGQGGGIFNYGASSPTIVDCAFIDNRCVGASPSASGAGIQNYSDLPITIVGCLFEANRVENFYPSGALEIARGAGIHNFSGAMTVRNCVFIGNHAHAGAGIFTWDETTVINSLFFDNTVVSYELSPVASGGDYGGGIASGSAGLDTTTIINCAFVGNSAGEAAGVSTVWNHHTVVHNSILWGNVATGEEVFTKGAQIKGSADIFYSCVEGLFDQIPGEDPPNPADFPGSTDLDPLFVSGGTGDLHLSPDSPCIDAGDNIAVPLDVPTDLDGMARFVDDPNVADTGQGDPPIVDMGPFELQSGPSVCDGITRFSARCKANGRLRVTVRTTLPEGTPLSFTNNGSDSRTVVINAQGKGKAVWGGQVGDHEICITECPKLCATAECP